MLGYILAFSAATIGIYWRLYNEHYSHYKGVYGKECYKLAELASGEKLLLDCGSDYATQYKDTLKYYDMKYWHEIRSGNKVVLRTLKPIKLV